MTKRLYSVLDVSADATTADIKKAYRRLAKRHHPDRNPDDAGAEARFKKVGAAFEVLGDPDKRARYDRWGDAMLQPGFNAEAAAAASSARHRGPRGGFGASGPGGADFDVEDLLGQLFGAGSRGPRHTAAGGQRGMGPGPTARAELQVDLLTAVRGGECKLTLDGGARTVRLPPGMRDGESLRLRGQGPPSPFGGPPGDLLLTVRVTPHPVYRHEGDHLHLDVPVTIGEAMRGARVMVPTLDGSVWVTVPAASQTGRVLRLRGKGVARANRAPGDLYVHVVVKVPVAADPAALDAALAALEQAYTTDVRAHLAQAA